LAKLEVFMLGDFRVLLDGELINESISHKGLALLSYLSINSDKSFSREKLSSLFWDSSNDEAARYNLRYTLWTLRKALKDNNNKVKFILSHKNGCQINCKSDLYLDVVEMENLMLEEDNINNLERVKEIYRGEFLEGFYVKDCMEFNDWVFYERERLQRKYFKAMLKLAEAYKKRRQYYKSIEAYEEILKINPLQEELYVELIKIYLELGHRKSALNQYERCCKILREELNISPKESTKKIYRDILKNKEADIKHDKKEIPGRILSFHNSTLLEGDKRITDFLERAIEIGCYPLNIPYYWLGNFIEEIIKYYDIAKLRDLPKYIIRDLARIQPNILEIFGDIINLDNLTCDTEKNRIFISLATLLNKLTAEDELILHIKDLEYMDEGSLEFIKYYFFKYRWKNVKLIITWNEDNKKIKEIDSILQKGSNIT